jgi:hypothetical protein
MHSSCPDLLYGQIVTLATTLAGFLLWLFFSPHLNIRDDTGTPLDRKRGFPPPPSSSSPPSLPPPPARPPSLLFPPLPLFCWYSDTPQCVFLQQPPIPKTFTVGAFFWFQYLASLLILIFGCVKNCTSSKTIFEMGSILYLGSCVGIGQVGAQHPSQTRPPPLLPPLCKKGGKEGNRERSSMYKNKLVEFHL